MEREWQKQALEYLRLHPRVGTIWRNDVRRTMGRKYGNVGKDRPKGLPDLIGIAVDGLCIGIELKYDKGKPTQEQMEFVWNMRSWGCYAGVAYNLNDIDDILYRKGKLRWESNETYVDGETASISSNGLYQAKTRTKGTKEKTRKTAKAKTC